MTATVNGVETSRGRWSDCPVRLRADGRAGVRRCALRPGDILGSGTVGGGCLLEIRDETLGRYLQPGDEVTLEIERLGVLRNPVVARPD